MKFTGVLPALATPLDRDERINTDALKKLIDFFIKKGADGFYVGGATGEGLALKTEERIILAQEAIKATEGRCPCIVYVASPYFNDAITIAKEAEKAGAAAISATPPMFFRYGEDDVYSYYKKLAESVNIPLMIYYNLSAGFNMSAEFAAKCFEIDNVTAIKWSSSNYGEMAKLKELTHGEMNIMNGPDDFLLTGLETGADGGIGLTYNFMFDLFRNIYDCFHKGDTETARKTQDKVLQIIEALHNYKSIPVTKLLLTEMGFDMGDSTFPYRQYSDVEKTEIINAMKKAGLNI
ncbi:MAG: dihydrodipicolinate synthase family protein [Clostridia bacterium]|nr:dihydrodipicolinate synthase family protein [Clostridia bacterium]